MKATRSGAGSPRRRGRAGLPSFEVMNVANVYVERKGRIEGDYDGA
jgi:hypothetical protein